MKKSTRRNVFEVARGLIGDRTTLSRTIGTLGKVVDELPSKEQPTFDALTDDQLRDLERLLAGLTAAVRGKCWAGNFEFRERTEATDTLLDKTKAKLSLRMRWRDHVRVAQTKDGTVIVAEPYGLGAEDFEDFITMEKAGWRILVNDRVGTYFPGHAICVILQPPAK